MIRLLLHALEPRSQLVPPAPRPPESVRVLTLPPNPELYAEVGLIAASGAGTDGALDRARNEAAEHGCDAIHVLGETVESGGSAPGSAYEMTRNHLRATCLAMRPASERAAPSSPPPTVGASSKESCSSASSCEPACRGAFVCVEGTCVSACNPPCADGERCVVDGERASCVRSEPALP